MGSGKKVSTIDYIVKTLLSEEYIAFCDTLGITASVKKLEAALDEHKKIYDKKVEFETDDS